MKVKRNEEAFKTMMTFYGLHSMKYRDRSYYQCPHCHKNFLLPKGDQKPDYLVSPQWFYAEAKGAVDRFDFISGITQTQIDVMGRLDPHLAWMFLEIGERIPNRKAYLIIWEFAILTFKQLREEGHRSVIYPTNDLFSQKKRSPTTDIFREYELTWSPGIGWKIPTKHPIRKYFHIEDF